MDIRAIRARARDIVAARDADAVEALIDELLGCASRLEIIAEGCLRSEQHAEGKAALYRRWATETRAVAAGEEPPEDEDETPEDAPCWFAEGDAAWDEKNARAEERARYRSEMDG